MLSKNPSAVFIGLEVEIKIRSSTYMRKQLPEQHDFPGTWGGRKGYLANRKARTPLA